MIRSLKRRRDQRGGAAAVELAVLLPLLAYLAVIATDWARLFQQLITVQACARNGALYASDAMAAGQSPYANVQQAAMAEAPEFATAATVTATSTTDSTGYPAVIVTVQVPFNTITNFPGVPSNQTLVRRTQMRISPLATK